MRVVADTNVLVSALMLPGGSTKGVHRLALTNESGSSPRARCSPSSVASRTLPRSPWLWKFRLQFDRPARAARRSPNQQKSSGPDGKECSSGIFIFTADERFVRDGANGEPEEIWRPSENVVFELGAASILYENRIVIFKEKGVSFPSDFSDLGYIEFEKDQLVAELGNLFRELVSLDILEVRAPHTMSTNVYVDAFNLYYGSLNGTPFRWLDLGALCARVLPKDRINRIRYFTANVSARPDNADAPQRQQAYLRALGTIPGLWIHYGHYLSHVTRMPLANRQPGDPRTVEVVKTEEKGSDVNLATYLLLDAFQHDCKVAVVVSNDSDLKLPIEIAQSELGMVVGVVNPHPPGRRSRALQPTFFKQLRPSVLGACQFPPVLADAQGEIRRPARW